jgi:hypothetical protein
VLIYFGLATFRNGHWMFWIGFPHPILDRRGPDCPTDRAAARAATGGV